MLFILPTLLLLQILSVTSYRYDYPSGTTLPILSLDMLASFTLNSTHTVHLQANTSFLVYHTSDNLSISFLLEESTQSRFTFLFTSEVTTWKLSGANFFYISNGTEISEERDQLLMELGDSLPIPLQRNHSYFCEVPFSHSSDSFLSNVEVSRIQFQIFQPSSEFSEPQVCLIAYNQYLIPTLFAFSLLLFLTIVVIINGVYHSIRKYGNKILKKNVYSVIPLKDTETETTK
ncbi:hypothetical protein LOD99_8269 [Oopsacas minuta]|uniref:Uncharacterized protein n=1 Tax=Oopsacas minuta TaxID=111878 RepID=A0AAV7JH38_9METZ|nr:hypothetical protein LOD99_8269 [Oopsacas minuta]